MIVVAIIGILATIAYPAYQDSVRKSRRSDGIALLMDAMARQERYYTDHNTYTSTLSDINYTIDAAGKASSTEGFYLMKAEVCAVATPLTSCVKLTAEPQNAQLSDGNLVIDSVGNKTRNGNTGWD
jgi:type IV pilus assembly protein PilE